jgi:hypothetical protein
MNNMMFLIRLPLAILLLGFAQAVVSSSQTASAQSPLAAKDILQSLPPSTFFVFRTSSVKDSATAIANSPFGQRLSSAPWESIAATHKAKSIPSVLYTLPWMGIEWRDLQTVSSPGYFVGFLDSKGTPTAVFLLQLGPNAAQHEFVSQWRKAYSQQRALKESQLKDSTKLWISAATTPQGLNAVLAVGPQWSAISSSPAAIQEWLEAKNSSTFIPSPLCLNTISSPPANASTVSFWLQPWLLLQHYTEKNEPKLFKSFSKSGLEQITQCAGNIQLDTTSNKPWRVDADFEWKEPLEKGLAVLSFTTGQNAEMPTLMKGTSEKTKFDNLSIAYLDNRPWFKGLNYLADLAIDEETPGGFADILDSLLTDPEGPKIDVRQEIIYKLGNPMFLGGSTTPDPKNAGQFQRQLLTAFPYPDTEAMKTLMNKMFANDEEVISETIGEHIVWHTVHNESLFISLSESESQTITAAAIDKRFVYLATDTEWLKNLAKEAAAGKPTPAEISSTTSTIGTGAFSFQQNFNLSSWLQRSWARIPESTPDRKDYESTDLAALLLSNTLVPETQADELPAWNQVQDLFGDVTITGVKTPTGVKTVIIWHVQPPK